MRRRRPFTLIEILTVIVIISILVGIALSVAKYAKNKARHDRTLAKLEALKNGLDNCNSDRGYYPITSGTMQLSETSLSAMPADWPLRKGEFRDTQSGRTYLDSYDGGEYMDAWGRPFFYQCDGSQNNRQTFDLSSAGPDGTIGTDDDITNWQRNN